MGERAENDIPSAIIVVAAALGGLVAGIHMHSATAGVLVGLLSYAALGAVYSLPAKMLGWPPFKWGLLTDVMQMTRWM